MREVESDSRDDRKTNRQKERLTGSQASIEKRRQKDRSNGGLRKLILLLSHFITGFSLTPLSLTSATK